MKIKHLIIIFFILATIYILFCIFLICMFFCSKMISIQLIGDKDIYLNINKSYFENGYKGYFFNKPYNKIKVINNIDSSKVGDYWVVYSINFFTFDITEYRNVHVVDRENPEIKILGDTYIYLKQNEEYIEPGYIATDNVDGDITSNVKIDSKLDTSKVGSYTINYNIEDSSGNKASTKREVEVINSSLLTGGISNFYLKGSFKDVILEYEEKEYDYFKDTIFLGDSNIVFLNTKGNYISSHQTWGQFNLNIAQINYSTFMTYENRKNVNLETAINTFHPKYLILTAGLNSANFMDRTTVINETVNFINYMKTNHSDIRIAFLSILPVRKYGTANGYYTVNRVNEYNYYIVQECHKHKVNFINFTDEIKSSEGFGDDQYLYCSGEGDCGFHLSDQGKAKLIDYVKHLNLERNY